MSLPHGAMDWSAYCVSGITWPYAHSLFEGPNSYTFKSFFSDLNKNGGSLLCVVAVCVLCLFLVVPWIGL